MDQQSIFVPDPVAALLLMRDCQVRTMDHERELVGFETYIVEQWACSRNDPAISITTFTGNSHHRIRATLFEVSPDSDEWPPALRSYVNFMIQNQARRHGIQQGVIMVTNLSIFPSTLTILPVPDGSVWKQLPQLRLNEALKRTGCAGRAGINLYDPSQATLSRFRRTYRLSDKVPVSDGVVQMVRMCQTALYLFGVLESDYCDGLLCDMTSAAIRHWWREIGFHFYNTEPIDGSLGTSTVSALLGLLLGARSRLHACGTAIAKDAFDTSMMKRSIGYFQRSQKLQRSRRLDYITLQRLHNITAKAAGQDGWLVQRAVKTTVAELGKGGEMMMGMVGAKDRGRISDVETTDLSQFIAKSGGEMCQWLWRGKSHKSLVRDQDKYDPNTTLSHGHPMIGYEASSSSSEDETANPYSLARNENLATLAHNSPTVTDKLPSHRRTMLQSIGGRMTDAKTGLGKIRAVAHARKDGTVLNMREALASSNNDAILRRRQIDCYKEFEIPTSFNKQGHSILNAGKLASTPLSLEASNHSQAQDRKSSDDNAKRAQTPGVTDLGFNETVIRSSNDAWLRQRTSSSSRSVKPCNRSSHLFHASATNLRRSLSLPIMIHNGNRTNSVTTGSSLDKDLETTLSDQGAKTHVNCEGTSQDPSSQNPLQVSPTSEESEYGMVVSALRRDYTDSWPRVSQAIERLLIVADANALQAREVSARRCSQLNIDSDGLEQMMQDATDIMSERLREVEALSSKLEYELGLLHSKIDDVEGGIFDLDQQISALEGRQGFLEADSPDQWVYWIQNYVGRFGLSRS